MRGTPRFLPQLEKNQEILPSKRAEALFLGGVFREIPLQGASTGDLTHEMVMGRDLTGNASQVSRGPVSEHLPGNQNLSVY